MKKSLRSEKESYKHYLSKLILESWLKKDYDTKLEDEFIYNNKLLFISDISCYKGSRIESIYEVVHKHDLNSKKLGRIQYYQYMTKKNFKVYSIYAEFIIRQNKKPEVLELYDFTTFKQLNNIEL